MAGLEASLMEQGLDWISRELVGDNTTSEAALAGQDPGPGEEDPFFRDSFFHPDLIPDSEPCKEILHFQVGASSIRLWDLLLLLPNLAFLLFLFYRLPSARARLGASPSHLHRCLYHLVLASSLAGAPLLEACSVGVSPRSILGAIAAASRPLEAVAACR